MLDPCHLYTIQPFGDTSLMIPIPFHKPDLGGIFKVYFRFSCACFHTTCIKFDKTFAIEVNDFGIATCFAHPSTDFTALKLIQMLICALSNTYNYLTCYDNSSTYSLKEQVCTDTMFMTTLATLITRHNFICVVTSSQCGILFNCITIMLHDRMHKKNT